MKQETLLESPVESTGLTGLEIAVIGMAGKFPGAENIHEFWENVKNGVESISFFNDLELSEAGVDPQLLRDPAYVKAYGMLEGLDYFDAYFFGYSPAEADIMDPQLRWFHQGAWNALEDAGYCPDTYEGLIGLYAGAVSNSLWELRVQLSGKAEEIGGFAAQPLINKDFLCMMVSYRLNLKGPAVIVQTACSTSLVAIHLASQAILNGECDMALAGGVTLRGLNRAGYVYREGMIYSPDGHCRAFAAAAQGTIAGDGLGLVVLKRLENALADNDHIYAVVKGSAINNDGIRKVAFTAPSIEGQAEVIITAQEMAEIEPGKITYIETHGTGTQLGDPVEIEALKLAFNSGKKNYCAIGAVKSNFGHLDHAAGVAGFIKVVLALTHRLLPPTLHFETPNPKIDFTHSPFYVNARLKAWEPGEGPLCAGVSSFGIGGTNAHVILEDARGHAPSPAAGPSREYQLLLLSAKTPDTLEHLSRNLARFFKEDPALSLADAAYTLQVGRKAFKHRRLLVGATAAEAVEILSNPASEKLHTQVKKNEEQDPPVIFMFPGQGSQYVNMGLGLYQSEPLFRAELDRCLELLTPIMDRNLKETLYPPARLNKSDQSDISDLSNRSDSSDLSDFNATAFAQPLLFAIEYALARLLMAWGIRPYAMIGHSIGEYVAACLAGVFTLEDALEIVALRGRLMQAMAPGSMLSVPLAEKELLLLLEAHPRLSLAAVNAATHCVVSGPAEAVETFARQLKEKGVNSQPLHTSHAFHSAMMEPVSEEFRDRLSRLQLEEKAGIPYISNLTGTWANIKEAATPGYWARHLRGPVRFYEGIGELFDQEYAIFLEVGPGRSLGTFVRQHERKTPDQQVIGLIRHPKEKIPDTYYLLKQVGHLWGYGKRIHWAGFYGEEKRQRLALPVYPFKGYHYPLSGPHWTIDKHHVDAALRLLSPQAPPLFAAQQQSGLDHWFYVPAWKPSPLGPSLQPAHRPGKYLVLVNEEDVTAQLAASLEQTGREVIVVRTGPAFTRPGPGHPGYTLNPRQEDDFQTLFSELKSRDWIPRKILHCWTLSPPAADLEGESAVARLEQARDLGFYSLLYLARALAKQGISPANQAADKIELIVITNGMQGVTGTDPLEPQKALVRGALQVIPVEDPGLACRCIDIDYPRAEPVEQLIETLAAEIEMNRQPADLYTAYRNNRRWVETYVPAQLEMTDPGPLVLKQGGVYLVSGGLGGIGLVLAGYLAREFKARLVLLGRSAFPGPDQWEEYLRTHGSADETAKKIRQIREMEASGAEVLICRADVANLREVQEALAQIEKRFGPVNGIIHAAGLPDGSLIPLRTREMSEAVFAPKVQGTLVLDALFGSPSGRELDFMVLCSSITAVLSSLGQAAYCAANAFLDAFSAQKAADKTTYTVSINWDAWQEVGMAVKAVEQLTAATAAASPRGVKAGHPLFDTYSGSDTGQAILTSRFRPDQQWVLDEHRMMGNAVLPGTAFLEMARAALQIHEKNQKKDETPGTLELHDVFFLTPLIVRENEEKEIRTLLKKENRGYTFSIASRVGPGENGWTGHAKGNARFTPQQEPVQYDPREIETRLQGEELISHPGNWTGVLDEEKHANAGAMVFGPRWNSLRRARAGENQTLAYLELPPAFVSDLELYQLHPALLDMAAISPRRFQHHQSVYLPFGYKKIILKKALTRTLFCHARFAKDAAAPRELLSYDLTLMDEQGTGLVEIQGYTLKRLKTDPSETPQPGQALYTEPPEPSYQEPPDSALHRGILPSQGIEVFKRVLANKKWPQVVVSTFDLGERIRESRALSAALLSRQIPLGAAGLQRHPRPQLSTPYVPPGTKTQQDLAQIWQQFLGLENVGIHDDFFELGGDSLKVMGISAKIHKELNVDIPLTEFFNRPTVNALAEYAGTAGKNSTGTYTGIDPMETREYYPLSSGQQRLYMLQQMDTASVINNLSFVFTLEGQLEPTILERVFSRLIRRHESFRTSFVVVKGETVQRVHEEVAFAIQNDKTGNRQKAIGNKEEIMPNAPGALIRDFIRPFDLTRAPLLRVGLTKTAQTQHILAVDMHHIISDGTSIGILVKEFMVLVEEKELPRQGIRYHDYSHWQNRQHHRENETLKGQETYWLSQLQGKLPLTNLPTDFPRPKIQQFGGASLSFTIDSPDTQNLKKIAGQQEVSLFTLLLSLLNIFMAKITGQEDLLIGTQVAGRRHSDLQNIIGVFINTLVLRSYPQKEKTLHRFLKETRELTLQAFENQEYPFEDLVEKRLGKRNLNRNPLFDVMFVWQNWESGEIRIPGLTLKPYENELKQTALLDLSIYGFDQGESLKFSLEYNTSLFKQETMERFITYFKEIVATAATGKDIKLGEIKIAHDLAAAKPGDLEDEDEEFGF